MKVLAIFVFVILAVSANRVKRCPGGCLASMLAQGCVVTGNKLYVNGIYTKDLNSTEINDMNNYKTSIQQYKDQLQQAYEENVASPRDLPEPPTTPSFCNSNMTTQYLFDGCVVQGNKVYVGGVFARDLTSTEIRQLDDYARGVEEYEEYVTKSMEQRMNAMREVFQGYGYWRTRQETTPEPSSTTTLPPITAPTPPDFCTSFS